MIGDPPPGLNYTNAPLDPLKLPPGFHSGRWRRLLEAIEADRHAIGWGHPAALYICYNAGRFPYTSEIMEHLMGANPNMRPTIRVDQLAARQVLSEKLMDKVADEGQESWETLRTMAINVAYARGEHIEGDDDDDRFARENLELFQAVFRLPGVFGYAVAAEGRHTSTMVARLNARGIDLRPFENHQTNLHADRGLAHNSARRVHGILVDGTLSHVIRYRSQQPRADMDGEGWRGDLTTSLRILADYGAGTTPPQEQFRQRYPTLDDLGMPRVPS